MWTLIENKDKKTTKTNRKYGNKFQHLQGPERKKIRLIDGGPGGAGTTCVLCHRTFKTPTFLSQHYASSHFRSKLMVTIPPPLCPYTFKPLKNQIIIKLG